VVYSDHAAKAKANLRLFRIKRISIFVTLLFLNAMLTTKKIPLIETGRLLIRPYKTGDEQQILDLLINNKSHLNRVLSGWVYAINDMEGAQQFVKKMKIGALMGKMFAFGVWLKDELVGEVVFFNIDWSQAMVELGSYTAAAYQGKGIATEAKKACMAHVFCEWPVNTIRAHCEVNNTASIRVNEKIGFKNLGQTKDGYVRFEVHKDFFNG